MSVNGVYAADDMHVQWVHGWFGIRRKTEGGTNTGGIDTVVDTTHAHSSHTEFPHNHSGNHCIRLSSIPDKQDTFLAMQQIFIRTDMSEV